VECQRQFADKGKLHVDPIPDRVELFNLPAEPRKCTHYQDMIRHEGTRLKRRAREFALTVTQDVIG
jgi:hypothetical protein